MSTLNNANSGSFPDDPDTEQGLLPDLNGVDLVMSLSPKTNQHLQHLQTLQQNSLHNINNHSTPFSVSDILSPIEEYRKLELNPPSPYRYDCQSVRCAKLLLFPYRRTKVRQNSLSRLSLRFQIELERIKRELAECFGRK
jgi:hypothetical protein